MMESLAVAACEDITIILGEREREREERVRLAIL
jgi:hypothetical protein